MAIAEVVDEEVVETVEERNDIVEGDEDANDVRWGFLQMDVNVEDSTADIAAVTRAQAARKIAPEPEPEPEETTEETPWKKFQIFPIRETRLFHYPPNDNIGQTH